MADVRVDPLLSYARRVGSDIKILLVVDPADQPLGADTALQLRDGDVIDSPVSVAPAGDGRARVEATVPGDRLVDGTWRMRLVDPTGTERRNLQTRVLVRAGMPIALLPGRPPDTLLPEPLPR
jgi:hypothetical protein